MADTLLTLKAAARQIGVRPDTLRQQIGRGRLQARMLGRDWFVTLAELEAYVAQKHQRRPKPKRRRPTRKEKKP